MPDRPTERDERTGDRVRTHCKAWGTKLMDVTRRNRLVHYKPLTKGTLQLLPDSRGLAALLAGDEVLLRDLLRPVDSEDADEAPQPPIEEVDAAQVRGRAREIARTAVSNLEERGVTTLFIALDAIAWTFDDGKPTESPLALLPVELRFEGVTGHRVKVQAAGELVPNPVLVAQWLRLHGQPEPGMSDEAEGTDRLASLRAWADDACQRIPGAVRRAQVVLDNFHFQKLAMYREMTDPENMSVYSSNSLVAAFSGDAAAVRGLTSRDIDPVDPRSFDRSAPDDEFLVLDADSSQLRIVEEVVRGRSGVIHGPPGTGKSQTIANLVASLTARGKRVLFVAEKRAALEVVKQRLAGVGLGHLVLDLHGAEVSRKRIAAQLDEALATLQSTRPPESTSIHTAYVESRRKLVSRMEALHAPRKGLGESCFSLAGHLLAEPPVVGARWRGAALDRLDREAIDEAVRLLDRSASFAPIVCGSERSAWMGMKDAAPDELLTCLDELDRLAHATLPALDLEMQRILRPLGSKSDASITDLLRLTVSADAVSAALVPWKNDVLAYDLDRLAQELAPASQGWVQGLVAFLFRPSFRAARRAIRQAAKVAGSLPRLLDGLKALASSRQKLLAIAPAANIGEKPLELGNVPHLAQEAERAVAELQRLLPGAWLDIGLPDLRQHVEALLAERSVAEKMPEARKVRSRLEALGLGGFLAELGRRDLPASQWPDAFVQAVRTSILDEIRVRESSLFVDERPVLDASLERFRTSDRDRIRIAAARVRRAHGERATAAFNADPDGFQLVRHEAKKKARHLSIRTLMDKAGSTVTTICPCVMASPLSVSQLLPVRPDLFDVVVFDEASQVFPEDAVPSLVRAPQAVVAGDPKQLPPTRFFAAGDAEDDENQGAFEGVESILDGLLQFLPSMKLEWHYRSRDERLIAFSNRHIYRDGLVTFPGVYQDGAVTFEQATAALQDGDEESSSAEVRLVVDRILEHARHHPSESLGVIAMGIRHRDRLIHALDAARDAHPELAAFFDEKKPGRFFVKNLEQVQGDERDVIFISVGYAPGRDGRLRHNFGPIQLAGGERRLNVAITRARLRCRVFASFTDLDMDPARCRSEGARLLRDYLTFARTGGRELGGPSAAPVPLNPFEEDVRLALEANGVRVIPQLGVSLYRLDFAVQHPAQPGRYVLAIECDGASYHSAPTARDRDRLRQQHLEALGWRIHRIWSTDWFRNREKELELVLREIDRALAAGARHPPPSADGPAAKPTPAPTPASPQRTARPASKTFDSIDDVSADEIRAWVDWVLSDGLLRIDDDVIAEVSRGLGFQRTGKRIRERIATVVAARRSTRGPGSPT